MPAQSHIPFASTAITPFHLFYVVVKNSKYPESSNVQQKKQKSIDLYDLFRSLGFEKASSVWDVVVWIFSNYSGCFDFVARIHGMIAVVCF